MLKKLIRKLFAKENRILFLFLIGLLVLNILPILAPLLAKIGLPGISRLIYQVYSLFCHQRHWRSFHLYDYQFAWCIRDVFMYGTLLITLFISMIFELKPIKWKFIILLIIPIALDGIIQTISEISVGTQNITPSYESNSLFRMMTGTLFSIALGFWMWPTLKESVMTQNTLKNMKQNGVKKFYSLRFWFIIIIIMNFVSLIFYVQIWNLTSEKFRPSNLLDTIPRPQEYMWQRCQRAKDSLNPLDACTMFK